MLANGAHGRSHDGIPRQPWGFGDVHFMNSVEEPEHMALLPAFVRPLPRKIDDDDVKYLGAKGALAIPNISLQNALLQAYVEYVHPYMPLMDAHEFLNIVHRHDGLNGQTSLLLYQAVMFSATAFVDMRLLRQAGYPTRKAARKAFFQKTRVRMALAVPNQPPSPHQDVYSHVSSSSTTSTTNRTALCSYSLCCS